jgi:hypothetical protein
MTSSATGLILKNCSLGARSSPRWTGSIFSLPDEQFHFNLGFQIAELSASWRSSLLTEAALGQHVRFVDLAIPDRKSTIRGFNVSVAQLDRASDFGSEGWGFESLQARVVRFER